MSKNKKKSKGFSSVLFGKLFGRKQDIDSILQEEQMQSPMRTVIKNFLSNKLAMTGIIVFLCIFLFVLIAPMKYKLDLSFQESTQTNIAPGFDMMKLPAELKKNAVKISIGPSYGVGIDKNGTFYIWGKTQITPNINLKDLPKELYGKKVIDVAAGYDHVLALTSDNEIIAWGNGRLKQLDVDPDATRNGKIVQMIAGYQVSAVVTEKGNCYTWGNSAVTDVRVKQKQQGKIAKVAFTADAMIGLSKEGEVLYLGSQKNMYSEVPEELESGVIDIAASGQSCAALTEDGKVVVWGNATKGEKDVPETSSKIVSMQGGRFHYTALTEDGKLVAWGQNNYGQTDIPSSVTKEPIANVYTGYYQNYVVGESGKVVTFGLKGYLLGTDELGRDLFNRLINGGKMTMTIGAISVVISTVLGIIVGGISGFFGGKVDMVLQRITEMVSSLPVLPFAMILSSIVGGRMTETQRILMIMVVLGVLSWTGLARLVRAQVLSEREQEFVTAARAMGVKQMSIVFKHIIPNVISVIIVQATLSFATSMLTESSLSFLGFGVALPRPTWGNMLTGCFNSVVIQNYWWRWVFPSIILGICVICINLIGDGLRDAIDPKSNER
jgi:peptide/nickel transport system permease protein